MAEPITQFYVYSTKDYGKVIMFRNEYYKLLEIEHLTINGGPAYELGKFTEEQQDELYEDITKERTGEKLIAIKNDNGVFYIEPKNKPVAIEDGIYKHTTLDWDKHFLDIASLCSKMSKDPSTKVGAAIKGIDKSVVSTGYNGFPSTLDDKVDSLVNREIKYQHVIHAEENALKFAKNRDLSGCTIYTTLFPCINCYKLIKESGITRIVTTKPTEDLVKRWGSQWEIVKKSAIDDSIVIDII